MGPILYRCVEVDTRHRPEESDAVGGYSGSSCTCGTNGGAISVIDTPRARLYGPHGGLSTEARMSATGHLRPMQPVLPAGSCPLRPKATYIQRCREMTRWANAWLIGLQQRRISAYQPW
jgi:hypothetical protein